MKPTLRFPEFRDAAEWEEQALSNVCERIMDGTHFSPKSKNGPRPYLTSKNIRSSQIDFSNVSFISDEEHSEIYARCPVQKHDVLLTKDGANTGNCAINPVDYEFSLLSSVAVLRGRSSQVTQDFLYHSIASERIQAIIQDSMAGQAITRITLEKLGRTTILIPSPLEQQRIAECLTSLDAYIAAQKRKVEELRAHKRSLMQQLFPRKGETTPRLRFPEFRNAEEWHQRPIGDMLYEVSRPIQMDDDRQYSLITVKRRYGGVVFRERLRGRGIKVKTQFIVKCGDFLISKRQIVHDAFGIVPRQLEGSIVSNEYSVLGPKADCDIEFFNYFCQQPVVSSSFFHASVGIVIEKMLFKLNTWLKLEFRFPSAEEQRRIASCLKAVEDRIAAESQKLDALNTHKKGLMQQLFPCPKGEL